MPGMGKPNGGSGTSQRLRRPGTLSASMMIFSRLARAADSDSQ